MRPALTLGRAPNFVGRMTARLLRSLFLRLVTVFSRPQPLAVTTAFLGDFNTQPINRATFSNPNKRPTLEVSGRAPEARGPLD